MALDITAIQVGEENVPGTEAASYKQWPGIIKSVKILINKQELLLSDISTQEEAYMALHGKAEYGWEIEFNIQNFMWLYWIMGTDVVTETYTHTMALNNLLPSLSIEMVQLLGETDSYSILFTGSKCEEATMNFVYGETPTVVLKGKSLLGAISDTPGSPAKLTTIVYEWHQSTTFTVNAVDYKAKVERASYTFKRTVTAGGSLSSQDPSELSEGLRGLVATYDLKPEDESLLALIVDETDFVIAHVIERTASTDNLTLGIPNGKTFNFNRKSAGDSSGVRVETVPVRAIGGYTAIAIDSIALYEDPV
jgi:hypothetical protein